MAKLIKTVLESSKWHDGSSATLYYEGEPTQKQLLEDCKTQSFGAIGPDVEDRWFEVIEVPNDVSKKAGLRRYQAEPCG